MSQRRSASTRPLSYFGGPITDVAATEAHEADDHDVAVPDMHTRVLSMLHTEDGLALAHRFSRALQEHEVHAEEHHEATGDDEKDMSTEQEKEVQTSSGEGNDLERLMTEIKEASEPYFSDTHADFRPSRQLALPIRRAQDKATARTWAAMPWSVLLMYTPLGRLQRH